MNWSLLTNMDIIENFDFPFMKVINYNDYYEVHLYEDVDKERHLGSISVFPNRESKDNFYTFHSREFNLANNSVLSAHFSSYLYNQRALNTRKALDTLTN